MVYKTYIDRDGSLTGFSYVGTHSKGCVNRVGGPFLFFDIKKQYEKIGGNYNFISINLSYAAR